MYCSIIPPFILHRLAEAGRESLLPAAASAEQALHDDEVMRAARASRSAATRVLRVPVPPDAGAAAFVPQRRISDAGNLQELPGTPVRQGTDNAVSDLTVNEAFDGLGSTFALFAEAYGRNSLDGLGGDMAATVHYGRAYDNAFWNGDRMVFGDGDGEVFHRFTGSLTVIGHELTHGITQHTTSLTYREQPGALNESISDVFAVLVEQYALGQQAHEAGWLIGAGLFTDAVQGVALRSLKAPGTAYDDDVLGKDPQPAHMAEYVQTERDNGGVHINSGIPSHAFYLVAEALGGNAWERAGQIWFDTITAGTLGADSDFNGFALATMAAAARRYGEMSEESVATEAAWRKVGIVK